MYCREYTLIKQTRFEIVASPLKCKCWHCDDCVPGLRQRVQRLIRQGKPTRWFTLTWRASRRETPDEAARLLIVAFRNLLRVLRRQHPGKDIAYFVVTERTENGYPHLHVMYRGPYISQTWLSEYMAQAIDAPIVDIRLLDKRRDRASYVTKYLTKGNTKFEGCQRYWKSRNWLPENPNQDEGPGWMPGDRFYRSRSPIEKVKTIFERKRWRTSFNGQALVVRLPRLLFGMPPPRQVKDLHRQIPETILVKEF